MKKYLVYCLILLHVLYTVDAFAGAAESCSRAHVVAAIAAASVNETVTVPTGSCEWSAAAPITISTAGVTLQGGIGGTTTITTTGTAYNNVVSINADRVTVKDFTFTNKTANTAEYPVGVTASGTAFRVTGNTFTGTGGYGIDIRSAFGLIDGNTFSATWGEAQPIVVRGASGAWDAANTIGTASNVFIENNTFTASNVGYPVCSTNAQCVFRYNTIGQTKIDMHGECTGNPGVRNYEIHNNNWPDLSSQKYFSVLDIRGGTGRIFNNTVTDTKDGARWYGLDEHAANHTYCAGYATEGTPVACGCRTVANGGTWSAGVALFNQIGVDKDNVKGNDKLYSWGNKKNGAYMPASVNTDVTLCATATQCGESFAMSSILAEGADFIESEPRPAAMDAYAAALYECPHPLADPANALSCDPDLSGAGTAGGYGLDNEVTYYTITPSVTGTGCSISPAVAQSVANGQSSTEYQATVNTGYKATWSIDGAAAVAVANGGTHQFTNVTADHTIAITCSPLGSLSFGSGGSMVLSAGSNLLLEDSTYLLLETGAKLKLESDSTGSITF